MTVLSMLDFCKNKLNKINDIIENSSEFPNELIGPHTYYRGYIRRLQRGQKVIGYGYESPAYPNQVNACLAISGWDY